MKTKKIVKKLKTLTVKRILLYIIIFILMYTYTYNWEEDIIEPFSSLFRYIGWTITRGNENATIAVLSSFVTIMAWIFLDKHLKKLID